MVALVCTIRGFHLAQQGVHFFQAQLAVGTHCSMASHGGQHIVASALQHLVCLVLRQFCQPMEATGVQVEGIA